jgi:hypothetical protein
MIAPKVELLISFAPGEPVRVTGPLANKMLCYGLLELARDTIAAYEPGGEPMIAPARMQFPPTNGEELIE